MRTLFALLMVVLATPATGQSLDLTVNGVGLSIGDSEEVTGLRLNFRDRRLRRVTGINATIWFPHDPARGQVGGLALGLPATGGGNIEGIGFGILGVSAEEDISGIMFGGIGIGSGNDMVGIAVAGLGVGAGRDVRGILVGGLGAGVGRDFVGFGIGGLGAGAGRDVRGVFLGGLGVGAGRDATGLLIGGLGVGAGQDIRGIMIGGVGAGAGRDLVGFSLTGIGVGAGRKLQGLHIAGVGAGAPEVRGLIVAGLMAGGENVVGGIIAPLYFKVEKNGYFRGISISAYNRIQGEQHGITIGIFNSARHLNGLQIGLLNYAGNKRKGTRWLPVFNYHRDETPVR